MSVVRITPPVALISTFRVFICIFLKKIKHYYFIGNVAFPFLRMNEFGWPKFTPLETPAIYGGDAVNESFVPLGKGG